MFSTLANWLFGCSHRHTSFPITCRTSVAIDGRKETQSLETYVVCLDCGQRFAYDWSAMRIAKQPAVEAESTRAQGECRTRTPFPTANRFLQRLVHHT